VSEEKKKTVTRAQYLQLVGLLALAARYNRMLDEILAAATELLGVPWDEGHTSDEVFDRRPDADDLLARLGVTIAD
jgi:hypothetical protein